MAISSILCLKPSTRTIQSLACSPDRMNIITGSFSTCLFKRRYQLRPFPCQETHRSLKDRTKKQRKCFELQYKKYRNSQLNCTIARRTCKCLSWNMLKEMVKLSLGPRLLTHLIVRSLRSIKTRIHHNNKKCMAKTFDLAKTFARMTSILSTS